MTKRISIVLTIIILFINIIYSQSWAIKAGGTSSDYAHDIAIDDLGNSFITGYFMGTATFGAGETYETDLISSGSADIYVAKYNSAGALQWAKKAGGTSVDIGYDITTDVAGNCILIGEFWGTATFGETEIISSGESDIFVAKYNSAGVLQWVKKAGGTVSDFGRGITVDGSGNSFITGWFNNGTATFGAGETYETDLTSSGGSDIFVAKYNSAGVLQWAKKAGGDSGDVGNGITTDGSGNCFVTGAFSTTATFGAGETNQTILTITHETDIFVAKYNSSGALLWAKKVGATFRASGYGVTADGSGNGLVTGMYNGTATFGAGETNQTILGSIQNNEIFIAKYNSDGTLHWAKSAVGISYDNGVDIATDNTGNSIITGDFQDSADFGGGTSLTSSGARDIFIAKYNSDGTLLWAKKAGGISQDYGQGVATDATGNCIVAGYFQSATATFGEAGDPNQTDLTSSGAYDIFIAKYNSEGALPVELSSFTVESTLEGVLFKWTTESETENLGFILERRIAGTDWTEIASYKTDEELLGQGSTPTVTDYEYLDVFVEPATTYEYRLADVDYNGIVTYHAIRKVTVKQTPLTKVIKEFTVLPAYPNPFNPSTTITYGIDNDSKVSVQIYDIIGQLISTLINTKQTQGWYSVIWNGTNQQGEIAPAGLYLSKITSNNEVKTTKLMLLK